MEFVPTGNRRLIVALYGITAVSAIEAFTKDGITMYGCIAIGLIVLGYFSTKFAEAMAGIVPALIQRIKG